MNKAYDLLFRADRTLAWLADVRGQEQSVGGGGERKDKGDEEEEDEDEDEEGEDRGGGQVVQRLVVGGLQGSTLGAKSPFKLKRRRRRRSRSRGSGTMSDSFSQALEDVTSETYETEEVEEVT